MVLVLVYRATRQNQNQKICNLQLFDLSAQTFEASVNYTAPRYIGTKGLPNVDIMDIISWCTIVVVFVTMR